MALSRQRRSEVSTHNRRFYLPTGVIVAILLGSVVLGPDVATAQLRPNTSPREYVVKRGDNLYRIALNNGTTIDAIREINGLTGTKIEVGQVLLLDRPTSSAATNRPLEVAQPEPTVTEDEQEQEEAPLFVEAFEDEAAPAQPGVEAAAPVQAAAALPPHALGVEVVIDPVSASNAFDVYHVKAGDTFESVAARLSLPPGLLMALNPDAKLPAKAGTPLRLPIEPSSILYRVKDGDTIEGIASWFGVSVEDVVASNELTDSVLRINQRLRISIAARPEPAMSTSGATGASVPAGGVPTQTVATEGGVATEAVRTETVATEGVPTEAVATETVTGESRASDGGIVLTEPAEAAPAANRETTTAIVTGNARVYPDQFTGRLMAIGKPYDPKKFTISHATLELGSVVLLTNEATGRKTFAEVTDRPPASVEYLADVSKAVADVLGLETRGSTIRLQVAR